jgi:hypothetical protein
VFFPYFQHHHINSSMLSMNIPCRLHNKAFFPDHKSSPCLLQIVNKDSKMINSNSSYLYDRHIDHCSTRGSEVLKLLPTAEADLEPPYCHGLDEFQGWLAMV